jgi:hypothetical protein
MRTMFALATCAIASLPLGAQAAVSDDLVFCSKLTSPRERIACYDAAARIAAASTKPSAPARELVSRPVADAPAASFRPVKQGSFEGFYAAIGGGYGVSGPRAATITANIFNPALNDSVYPNGWVASGSVGYNIVFDRWLVGLELDGRIGNERAQTEQTNVAPGGFVTGTEFMSYGIKNDAGVHLSARLGAIFGDTLIFTKAGVGASHITETAIDDSRAAAFCLGACLSGTLRTTSKTAWVPSYLFGVGLEQNFGSLFVRTQAELEAAALNETRFAAGNATSNLFWTVRALAAIGFRF